MPADGASDHTITVEKKEPGMSKAWAIAAALGCLASGAYAAAPGPAPSTAPGTRDTIQDSETARPDEVTTTGSVTINGTKLSYRATAGTLAASSGDSASAQRDTGTDTAQAVMSYVAYFKSGTPTGDRPITFFWDGGPGSSTVFLHIGAFGPRRLAVGGDGHVPPAPYQLVNNSHSLLDASDLVFIDAPGTGFGRVSGKDAERAFRSVDGDAHAFEAFIKLFLSRYQRWNSPRFIFGESYGTLRSALVIEGLQRESAIEFNGMVQLSQVLSYDTDVDGINPGDDQAYINALPSYAATAWYHHRLGADRPATLEPFLKEVEHFARTEYAQALQMGSELDPARRQVVAARFAALTGLAPDYVLKADLRIDVRHFRKALLEKSGLTTGDLDSRFVGPVLDPLAGASEYDPLAASIGSAFVSTYNDYARTSLGYGQNKTFAPIIAVPDFDFSHSGSQTTSSNQGGLSVMADLASAMKRNPNLKILLLGGYFDLSTPYFSGWYEMHHLPMPPGIEGNIEYRYYRSGHMVYLNEDSLKIMHDDVARFIEQNRAGSARLSLP